LGLVRVQWVKAESRSIAIDVGMTRNLFGRHGKARERDEDIDGISVGENAAVAGTMQRVWS